MSSKQESFSGDDVYDPFPRGINGVPLPVPAPRFGYPHPGRSTVRPDIDWQETAGAHVFTADVPGMKKGEVAVEIRQGNILEISGERSLDKVEKDTWHLLGRSSGSFVRRFRLPENAKVDCVGASMANGVLTVTVPKDDAKKKPEVISVEISG